MSVSNGRYFVTGIGTSVGKTVVSAVLCEALGADYWKPIQAGHPRDSERLSGWLSPKNKVHKEAFVLKQATAPQEAAEAEGIRLDLSLLSLPAGMDGKIIIEGVGGCLVPLNDKEMAIDMARHFDAKVIYVVDFYLGSINHSLLTSFFLRSLSVEVSGMVFNGAERWPKGAEAIARHSGHKVLARLPYMENLDGFSVKKEAERLRREGFGLL